MRFADQTFAQRQLEPSRGEVLFEDWCQKNSRFYRRLGFDQHTEQIPEFYDVPPVMRNLPDYLYKSPNGKYSIISVKGTESIKKTEADLIPSLIGHYGSKALPWWYAFCLPEISDPVFLSPVDVMMHYMAQPDQMWKSDGKVYRTIDIKGIYASKEK